MPSRTRRQPSSVSSSWRLVEGENDSFDTTLAPSFHEKDLSSPPSSMQPSSGLPSQLSDGMSLDSQDSIRDFSRHQDDPDNIMREPFRPSLPSARGTSYSSGTATVTPGMELRMPRVEVESARRRRGGYEGEDAGLRRRGLGQASNGRKRGSRHYDEDEHSRALKDRMLDSVPSAMRELLLWVLDIIIMAFRYAKKPLALMLAIYISFGAIIMAQNMVTRSLYVSLSPICRIPGASLFPLPFCPSPPTVKTNDEEPDVFEFDELMGVQGNLEKVLEKSAEGVSLPYEMKRSEITVRDLRTLVKASEIQVRDELVHEFDSYVDIARQSSSDLQRFNGHCGSAVDSVISINRWTSRYIDSLSPSEEKPSLMSAWTSWVFSPFLPSDRYFNERMILEKYVEHTAQVSERITALILEAQVVLSTLEKAENHLSHIHQLTQSSAADTNTKRGEVFWNLWTLVGQNVKLNNLDSQLKLLRRVETHRTDAVKQVMALVMELQDIQVKLEDLRDRVAAPELTRGMPNGLPLSVHIETIERGVERLEGARRRIGVAEEERVREVLKGVGVKDEPWIDAR